MVDLNLSPLQLQNLFEYGDHTLFSTKSFRWVCAPFVYTNMNNGVWIKSIILNSVIPNILSQ